MAAAEWYCIWEQEPLGRMESNCADNACRSVDDGRGSAPLDTWQGAFTKLSQTDKNTNSSTPTKKHM